MTQMAIVLAERDCNAPKTIARTALEITEKALEGVLSEDSIDDRSYESKLKLPGSRRPQDIRPSPRPRRRFPHRTSRQDTRRFSDK
jgi:hypothetical protein